MNWDLVLLVVRPFKKRFQYQMPASAVKPFSKGNIDSVTFVHDRSLK